MDHIPTCPGRGGFRVSNYAYHTQDRPVPNVEPFDIIDLILVLPTEIHLSCKVEIFNKDRQTERGC